MVRAEVKDVLSDVAGYLRRVEAGETVLLVRDDAPVAELRPVHVGGEGLRPYGLAEGRFRVPDDFDAPLPEVVLKAFEEPQ